eukprot:2164544-Amphidinium_carterae.1
MAACADDESYWDCWPEIAEAGVLVTALQARQTGLRLAQRCKQWRAAGEPLLARRDYENVQDNRTLQEMCVPGKDVVGPLLPP